MRLVALVLAVAGLHPLLRARRRQARGQGLVVLHPTHFATVEAVEEEEGYCFIFWYGRPHTPAERIEPTEHFLAHVTALRYQERPPAGDGAELPDILDLL